MVIEMVIEIAADLGVINFEKHRNFGALVNETRW